MSIFICPVLGYTDANTWVGGINVLTYMPDYIDRRIDQLPLKPVPDDNDLIVIEDAVTNTFYKATFNSVSGEAPVKSVAGKVGDVTLTKTDVGLGNVDNTSDLDKPTSTATSTALGLKADTTYVNTQNALDEKLANKATSLASPDNTKYPTTLAVSTALTGITPVDATTVNKGIVQLAGELGGPNSTAAAPTIKNLDRVYNIIDYGAPTDGTSTTTSALNAAIAAANAAGGGTVTGPSGLSYYFATPATMLSNVQLKFHKVRFYSAITVGGGQGIININNKTDMIIDGITFDAGGNIMGITSFGHNRLLIKNCVFTGTTSTPNGGILQFDGTTSNGSSVGFFNTKVKDCRFYDVTTLNARTFNVRARDGHHCEDLQILNCEFNNVGGPAISINTIGPAPSPGVTPVPATVGYVRRVLVDGCKAYNLREGNVAGDITSASLVNAGSSAVNTVFDLKVTNCDFYNDVLTTGAGGLVWAYGVYGLVISNNTAKGAFIPPNNGGLQGPFVSLGRVSSPCVNVVITGNKLEGFNSACDTDSMVNVEIANNVVTACGNPFYLGYQVQRYVNIHDNVFHNSIDYDPIQNEGYRFSSCPKPIKCKIYNNLIIDDRSIPAPTGITAGTLAGGSLLASTVYYYKVTALDAVGETVGSAEVTATTTSTNKQVRVNYLPVQGAIQYKLYRSMVSESYGPTSLAGTFYYHRGAPASNSGITDTGAALTTGTPPATSTVGVAKMNIGLKLFGGGDFSDVQFHNNRFYLPNSTFSGGLLVKEFGTEISPDTFNNEYTDSAGTVYDDRAERQSNKGVANGYAPLDGAGLVPVANLPTTTGSFVDLTTNQSIAGNKTFTGATTANTPIGSNLVPLTVTQSDTTNNPNALNVTNNTTGRGINITKTSNNYALAITNTGAQDSIYTTQNTTLLTGARIATFQSNASQTNPSTAALFVQLTNAGSTRPAIWAINAGTGKALLASGGISTDALQIGTSSTSGFALVTDGLGNGTYQQLTQPQILNLVTDLAAKAPLASPTFTGIPIAPTATAGDSSTQIATTAFVTNAISTFDDVLEYSNLAAFPVTGVGNTLYIANDTGFLYRWSGSTYVQVGGGTPADASTVSKGIVQLTTDLGGTATAPTTPTAVHLAGNETVTGTKTFSSVGIMFDGNAGAAAAISVTGVGFTETIAVKGIYIGGVGGDTHRILFSTGTASQNWQIDNNAGNFRWFTPGTVRMQISAAGVLTLPTGSLRASGTTTSYTGGSFKAGAASDATSTLQSAGSFAVKSETITADKTYTSTTAITTVFVDTTAGAVTVTLPQIADRIYIVKKITTDANALNITSTTGTTEGVATFTTTSTTRPGYNVQSTGTNNWFV